MLPLVCLGRLQVCTETLVIARSSFYINLLADEPVAPSQRLFAGPASCAEPMASMSAPRRACLECTALLGGKRSGRAAGGAPAARRERRQPPPQGRHLVGVRQRRGGRPGRHPAPRQGVQAAQEAGDAHIEHADALEDERCAGGARRLARPAATAGGAAEERACLERRRTGAGLRLSCMPQAVQAAREQAGACHALGRAPAAPPGSAPAARSSARASSRGASPARRLAPRFAGRH
jgi:hypothetical protein